MPAPLPHSRAADFPPDLITQEVLELVNGAFSGHPGSVDAFDWPVTRRDGLAALRDFMEHRLVGFDSSQEWTWSGEQHLYYSRISSALNLRLLNPREVILAAEEAYRSGLVSLSSAEGFIRTILGWREFLRGVYWLGMPEYADVNEFEAEAPLPEFYWTGETEMQCLRDTIGKSLDHGYAHHSPRQMIAGVFALQLGVRPRFVYEWFLSVYADVVEWAALPYMLGASQWADGGYMTPAPFLATGEDIDHGSSYCPSCRFCPERARGDNACPFTTLYWDFLARNRDRLRDRAGAEGAVSKLEGLTHEALDQIRHQASMLRSELGAVIKTG